MATSEKTRNLLHTKTENTTQIVWIKNLKTFRSFFTVIFDLKFGIHIIIIGSGNITTTTIKLLKWSFI